MKVKFSPPASGCGQSFRIAFATGLMQASGIVPPAKFVPGTLPPAVHPEFAGFLICADAPKTPARCASLGTMVACVKPLRSQDPSYATQAIEVSFILRPPH